MKKVSDAVSSIIEENQFLRSGMQSRLLNLSQVARYIAPAVEAKLNKSVTPSAILMSLSRVQSKYPTAGTELGMQIPIDNLVIHSNLCILSYAKKNKVRAEIQKFYNKIQHVEGYITLTEGMSEVSIIFDKEKYKLAREIISERPSLKNEDVAALGVKFKKDDIKTKGLYFSILQEIFIQGISLVETASAATELILFLEEKDLNLAFQTLYKRLKRSH